MVAESKKLSAETEAALTAQVARFVHLTAKQPCDRQAGLLFAHLRRHYELHGRIADDAQAVVTAKRIAIDEHRRATKVPTNRIGADDDIAQQSGEGAELPPLALVGDCLARLPAVQRAVVECVILRGCTRAEAVAAIGLSEFLIARALREALAALRIIIVAEWPELAPEKTPDGVTLREAQVAALAASSHSSCEIAAALGIRNRTVENHRASVRKKIGVHDTAGITRWALARGLTQNEFFAR